MSYSTLEDFFGDIVGKAIRGLGLNAEELGGQVGLSAGEMSQIASYDLIPEDDTIRALASALSLDGDKLVLVARGWVPEGGNDRFVTDSLTERLRVIKDKWEIAEIRRAVYQAEPVDI